MKKWLTGVIVAVIVGFVGFEMYSSWQEAQHKEVRPVMQTTDFELPTLDGGEMTLHEHAGKVIILNFWASWCEPCKVEMPHFQTYYEQHAGDVEILAVNVTTKDSVSKVKDFIETYGYTYPILLDEVGDVTTMYGAFTIPTTIIIDREGQLVQEIRGPLEEELLEQYVTPLL